MNRQISFIENIFITIVAAGIGDQIVYSYNLVSIYCQTGWKIKITKEDYETLIEYYREEEHFREEKIELKTSVRQTERKQDYRYHAAWVIRPAIPIYGFENIAVNIGNKKGALIVNMSKAIKEDHIRLIAQTTVNHAHLQQIPFFNSYEYQPEYTEHTDPHTGRRFLWGITSRNHNTDI